MLNRVNFPLTKAQVGDFVLERGYTNFLTLSQVISELIDAKLVTAQSLRNRTHLELTKDGLETLRFFENRISEPVKSDIDTYFKENEFTFRNEMSISADYYKSTSGEYEAHLVAKDRNALLMELTLSVPVEEAAIAICDNWQKKNQDIYQYLVSQLF